MKNPFLHKPLASLSTPQKELLTQIVQRLQQKKASVTQMKYQFLNLTRVAWMTGISKYKLRKCIRALQKPDLLLKKVPKRRAL